MQVLKVAAGRATCIYPDGSSVSSWVVSSILKCMPGRLEEYTLLRIEAFGFSWAKPEKPSVKEIDTSIMLPAGTKFGSSIAARSMSPAIKSSFENAEMDFIPSRRLLQNCWRFTAPGKRQLIPIIAMLSPAMRLGVFTFTTQPSATVGRVSPSAFGL